VTTHRTHPAGMITTPVGPTFMQNDDQSGARSGDHTHMLNEPPYGDELSGPQMTAWNVFFVLIAVLCVAAMVLGVLSMSHCRMPTVLVWAFGAPTIAVGVAGLVLAQTVFAGLTGDYSAIPLIVGTVGCALGTVGLLVIGLSTLIGRLGGPSDIAGTKGGVRS